MLCFLLHQSVTAQCTSCTINITSNSSQSYSLGKNDVLCIQSGVTFTGGINGIHKDALICVANGASFNPPYLNNWKGVIHNHGTLQLPSFSMSGNGELINDGEVSMSSPNINGNGAITNNSGYNIVINGNLHLNGNTTLTNDGNLSISGDFSLQGSSDFENNGALEIGGNANINKLLENRGYLRIKGHINNNSAIHNYCTFVSDRGFSNSGTKYRNEGFIWILGTSQFANSGTFYQAPGAHFRGHHFANSGYITGGGDYYFSGNTANSAYVGYDGLGINFYDASLSNQSLFFDQQAVAPHFSVTKNSFVPADTSSWGGGGTANAGNDQVICISETQLNASGSNGSWSLVSGSLAFEDINDPNTLITEVANGENIVQWSEAAACGVATDEVTITLENPADTTIWTGSAGHDWHNPDNWTRCIPGNNTITIIPITANAPEIRAGFTGYALKVKVERNSALKVKAGAKLIVATD